MTDRAAAEGQVSPGAKTKPGDARSVPDTVWTRAGLAMLAVVFLSLGSATSYGTYFRLVFVAILVASAFSLAACLWTGQLPLLASRRSFLILLAVAAVSTSGAAMLQPDPLLYIEPPATVQLIRLASGAGFLLLVSFLFWPGAGASLGFRLRVLGLFLTGAVLRADTIRASPDPLIDVYTLLQEAPINLLRGINPYATDYDSPYNSERAKNYEFAAKPEARPAGYPPLPYLLALPFRAAGQDARWANVLCDLLAALVLYLTARSRGSPLIGAFVAGTYLNLPRVPFMMEQAWFEPMLAATLGGGLFLLERGRRWPGHVLLALGLTGKQYGVILVPALLRARRHEARTLVLALAAVLVVLFLPFFLWGPEDFLSIVLFKHFEREAQYDSLTLLTAVHDLFGVKWPRWVSLLPGLALIAWLAWRTPRQGTEAGLWMGTALLVFCLCHTQGYFNYFYLCQYLWLLGIAGSINPKPAGTSVQ